MPRRFTVVYWLLAGVAIVLNLMPFFTGAGVLKSLPALLLAVCAWRYCRPVFGPWVAMAVFCGALGDFSLSSAEREWFMPGLVAFLVGHLAYCVAFRRNPVWERGRLVAIAITGGAVMVLLGVVLRKIVGAGEYQLIFPVVLYVAVIVSMMAIVVLHRGTSWFLAAGGIVFIVSDAHIAVNHIVLASPVLGLTLTGYATYYLAQYFLVAGAVVEAREESLLRENA